MFNALSGTRVRELPQHPFDPKPERGRRPSFAALPLVDHGFASRTHLGGERLLTETEPEPQTHECRRVVYRYGHAAHGHETAPTASIGIVKFRRELAV